MERQDATRIIEGLLLVSGDSVSLRRLQETLAGVAPQALRQLVSELNDDDLDTSFYSEEKVVLEDLVSEQINLALPMRPLCSPDCKGLCLTCGTDLNRGSCTCR